MGKDEIGFRQGAPQKPERWGKMVGGVTFVFTKTREAEDIFLYECKCKSEDEAPSLDSSTGFRTDRDLGREEIEARSQFREFIEEHLKP